jgi:hypothetical protein
VNGWSKTAPRFRRPWPQRNRWIALAGVSMIALLTAGCDETATAPVPAATQAAITGDAAIATASAKIASSLVAAIPNASPTLLKNLACGDAAIADLATTVANAVTGSSAEADAIAALVQALASYNSLTVAGGACAPAK